MKFPGYTGQDNKEQSRKCGGVVCLIPCTRDFFLFFLHGNPCLRATSRTNGWTDFHDFFVEKIGHGTYSGCCGWPLESGIDFSDNNIMEKLVNGFSRNVHDVSGTTQVVIIVFQLGACVPVSTITVKWMNRFSWNFQDMSVMTWEVIWNILVIRRITPWIQGSFFIFSGSVCYQRYGITDGYSWNFRIWTHEGSG